MLTCLFNNLIQDLCIICEKKVYVYHKDTTVNMSRQHKKLLDSLQEDKRNWQTLVLQKDWRLIDLLTNPKLFIRSS